MQKYRSSDEKVKKIKKIRAIQVIAMAVLCFVMLYFYAGIMPVNADTTSTTYDPSYDPSYYTSYYPTYYTVTVNNSYAGTTGAGSYTAGTTVTINAGSRTDDYVFDGWTVNAGGVTPANANSATTTFTMPSANVTVTANWRYTGTTTTTYTVTYAPGTRGTFTAQTTSGLAYGAATPGAPTPTGQAGWTFTGWSPTPSATVTGNATYTAQWRQDTPPPPDPEPPHDPVNPSYPLRSIDPDDPIYENILDWLPPLSGIKLDKGDHNWYIRGYEDDSVRPEGYITRAEMAMIFYRLTLDDGKHDTIPRRVLSDVDPGAWYAKAVTYLYDNEIIKGYEDGTFRPNEYVSRAEATAMAIKFDQFTLPFYNPFYDLETSHWAAIPILAAWNNGWLIGYEDDATIRPDERLTRAEMVAFLNRVLERKIVLEDIPAEAEGFADLRDTHWAYCDLIEASNSHDYERKYADEYGEYDRLDEVWTAVTGNGKTAAFNE